MPLHPDMQAILERTAAANLPPVNAVSPTEARAVGAARRAGVAVELEPMASIVDIDLPVDGTTLRARHYVPVTATGLPVLVYFHGGGWVLGDLEVNDALCRALANRSGCAIVSVAYRLAPEHRFPIPAEDAYAAAGWLADHASDLDLDGSRIAVGGASAGGNLAAAVCLMARDRGGPRIRCQALLYPVIDCARDTRSYVDNATSYGLTAADMAWFWNHYLGPECDGTHPYASPLRAPTLQGLPPACVVSAEFDPLRDEADAYADRLRSDHVIVDHLRVPGVAHGFLNNPAILAPARETLDHVGAFLRAHL